MFRGLPPGYTKSLERKVDRLETILQSLSSLSLTPQQYEVITETALGQHQGTDRKEIGKMLQKYLPPAVDNPSPCEARVVAPLDLMGLPSPPTSVNDCGIPESSPNGLLSVNENSVITHMGVTNGLHLVTPCEIIDHEIWYPLVFPY